MVVFLYEIGSSSWARRATSFFRLPAVVRHLKKPRWVQNNFPRPFSGRSIDSLMLSLRSCPSKCVIWLKTISFLFFVVYDALVHIVQCAFFLYDSYGIWECVSLVSYMIWTYLDHPVFSCELRIFSMVSFLFNGWPNIWASIDFDDFIISSQQLSTNVHNCVTYS